MQVVGGFAILLLAASISACSSSSTNPATASGGGNSGADGGETGGTSGAGASGGTAGSSTGGTGGGVVNSNCSTVTPTCGPTHDADCCARALLPSEPFPMGRSTSGTDAFANGQPDEQPEHTATPQSVELDVYEVTVARFKAFVDALPDSLPKPGDGEHPGIPNSGWDPAWDPEVDPDYVEVTLQCGNNSTWSFPIQVENYPKPINCLNWQLAFAFCAWDGGFLPTEAEWEAAAAGGSENRLYPWGSNDPDALHASFSCKGGATTACEFDDILPVGSIAGGIGKFGHYDLGGSVSEWTLDAYSADWYKTAGGSCTNCANLAGDDRVLRGGAWNDNADELRAARRTFLPASLPDGHSYGSGVRCARTPKS